MTGVVSRRRGETDFRERTRVEFGLVEAYAGRHLRVASIVGTSMRFSLQEATASASASTSQLRSLIDGSALRSDVLRSLIPSLASVRWFFEGADNVPTAKLTAMSDGICVSLSIDNHSAEGTPFVTEGRLRGVAARIVVQLEYGE